MSVITSGREGNKKKTWKLAITYMKTSRRANESQTASFHVLKKTLEATRDAEAIFGETFAQILCFFSLPF